MIEWNWLQTKENRKSKNQFEQFDLSVAYKYKTIKPTKLLHTQHKPLKLTEFLMKTLTG